MTVRRRDHEPYPFVVIIDTVPATPIFHAGLEWDEHGQFRVRCGPVHVTAGGWTRGARLPLRHAAMFARPCQRCFPGRSS